MIQIRMNSNMLAGVAPEKDPPTIRRPIWMPFKSEPLIDFRDSETVWVWIADNLCVELSADLVARLATGFVELAKRR